MDKSFHIFDFDYTLYLTTERVLVWSPRGNYISNGKNCLKLNANDFHHYELASDEEVNEESFEEFNGVNWQNARPIYPTLNAFNCAPSKMILTARPPYSENAIRLKLGKDFEFVGLGDGAPQAKINFIQKINQEKYSRIIVYEDSHEAIAALRSLGIPCVKVKVCHDKISLEYFGLNKRFV